MYWILMSERSDENELSLNGLPKIFDKLDLNFDRGELIKKSPPIIEMPYLNKSNNLMTDNLVAAPRMGLLINEKLKSIFESLDIGNIQYFRSKLIESNTGEVDESYCVANVVGLVSCVDQDKSDLDYYDDGDIEFIDRLVLNLNTEREYGHIFRIAEYSPLLVVSSQLKLAIESAKITGIKIYKPEEFSL